MPTPHGSPLDYSVRESKQRFKMFGKRVKAVEPRDLGAVAAAAAAVPADALGGAPLTGPRGARVAAAVRGSFVLSNLPPAARQLCLDSLERRVVQAGEILVEQVCVGGGGGGERERGGGGGLSGARGGRP